MISTILLIVATTAIAAELIARLSIFVLMRFRPDVFVPGFKPLKHSIEGGWMHHLFSLYEKYRKKYEANCRPDITS